MSFLGFPRPDGEVGIRNHIGIISTVICANDVSLRIAQQVEGVLSNPYRFKSSHQDPGKLGKKSQFGRCPTG